MPAAIEFCATDSGELPYPSCGLFFPGGGDIWFSLIVPASGALEIETSDDGTGNFDTAIELYSGVCGALTYIDCDNIGSMFGRFSLLSASGLTPGSTVYARVWEAECDDFGTFNICARDPSCAVDYATGSMNQLTGAEAGADYEALGVIDSDQMINGNTDYDSAIEINLLANFETTLGVLFDAFIDGCNGGSGGNQ